MRWIYISPHLDDAALSAGGWIYDQTQASNPVEIWTILCGYPPTRELSVYARFLHLQWGMPSARQVVSMRRIEDKKAAAILGAKVRHFDFLDCIYRRDKKGNWLYFNIFTDPQPGEADLPAQIAKAISARLKPDDKLVCQLGIGKHVDHVIVRRAAELLGHPLHYVADIPYYFNTQKQLKPHTVGMKKKVERVSRAGLKSWKEAVLEYKSQLSSLFKSPRAVRSQINQYCSENEGLPFWGIN
ncbi:MAG: PIG-L family deacetylase [Chloroflexi bacterium]|nr:PIG-L family deacetylase [Chloroflexota bacterium]